MWAHRYSIVTALLYLSTLSYGQITPAATGTSHGDGIRSGVSTYTNTARYIGLTMWNVPATATNQEAVISFDTTAPLRTRQELFAVEPDSFRSDFMLFRPREFIGALETNPPASQFALDVTPWTRRFAGKKLGVVFAITADEPRAT